MAEYKQSFVVKFLHELPHLDLTFRPVNSTFAPDNLSYREVGIHDKITTQCSTAKLCFTCENYRV